MGYKKLWGSDNMKKIILILIIIIIVGVLLLIQEFYIPQKGMNYKYSPTDFIEPTQRFIFCYVNDDCLKVKGSTCPPESGGVETCVNKDFMQEYNTMIEELAGKHWEIGCPEIYLVTNKICSCIDNKCVLM